MLKNTSVQILGNDPNNSPLKVVFGDFQEYDTTIQIGSYTFNITKRVFIDIEPLIDMNGYLKIENSMYKILHIITYSEYQEVWLYLLNRQVVV